MPNILEEGTSSFQEHDGAAMKGTFRLVALFSILLALAGCAGMEGIKPFWALSEADFQPIKAGMTQGEVEKRVGKPLWSMSFPAKAEEVWSYDYLDHQTHMKAVITFDDRGVLKNIRLEYDMDFYSGPS
jgi:outer membrane protein assembly factor BamE (lipoprotein component of BamABCDE complex)